MLSNYLGIDSVESSIAIDNAMEKSRNMTLRAWFVIALLA